MASHFKRELKYGETREDGYRFVGFKANHIKKNGYYAEDWRSPEAFKKYIEKNRANKKKIYDMISKAMADEKIRRGCKHCGYNKEAVALDFHHIDPQTKIIAVASHWRTSWKQFEKMKKEWEKCDVLCSRCHRIEEKRLRNARK